MPLNSDDTEVLFKKDNCKHVYRAESGRELKLWFDQNILTMNIDKTKCMNMSLNPHYDPINAKLTFIYVLITTILISIFIILNLLKL